MKTTQGMHDMKNRNKQKFDKVMAYVKIHTALDIENEKLLVCKALIWHEEQNSG